MHIKVERIRTALKLLDPVIPAKPTVAILTNALLKDGKVSGTNLEIAVFIDLPEATETCLLPFKEVEKILETVPGDLDLTIEVVKNNIRLSWEGGKAAFPTANPADYPDANRYDAPTLMSDVDGTALIKGMFSMIPYAAGTKDARPVLQGVTMYMGEKAAAAAADGFRMAYAPLPFSFGTGGTLIFPLDTLRVLNYLWDKTPVVIQLKPSFIETIFSKRTLTLAVGNSGTETCKWAGFKFGSVKVISNLIEGNPPDHKSLIPTPDNTIRVIASELNRAVIRTKDVALAASGIVRLKWSRVEGASDFGDRLEVYATSVEIGEVSAEINVSAPDGPGHVAISYKSLTEYLKGKNGVVKIGISSQGSGPILLEYSNTPLTLVMPMMVQW